MNIDKQFKEIKSISQVIQKSGLGEHLSDAIAVGVFDAGYRKADEVAREIFEVAIELAKHSADKAKMRADNEANVLLRAELRGQQIGANLMLYELAELKKKYSGEDINVPIIEAVEGKKKIIPRWEYKESEK